MSPSAASIVVRPRVAAWGAHAARVEQEVILAAMAREAKVRAYLDARTKRRARVEVEQFELAL